MRAGIFIKNVDIERSRAGAMLSGLTRHGVDAEIGRIGQAASVDQFDFCVCWGKRGMDRLRHLGAQDVLLMELGYLGDRLEWTSLGWNGLNGRAAFGKGDASRWRKYFAPLIREWKPEGSGDYVLVAEQVPGDAAVEHVNYEEWRYNVVQSLGGLEEGGKIRCRPHPLTGEPDRTLEEDLRDAALVVTFNSNLGVDAVMAGTPTVVMDEGGMARPVAGRDIDDVVRPSRNQWAQALAWTQWKLPEIESGAAWDIVRQARNGPPFFESFREEKA